MTELTKEELLSLKDGTIIYATYPSKVVGCELYGATMTGSIWGNFPKQLMINLSGIGLLYDSECTYLYLDKNSAMTRAREWEIENRKSEVARWEDKYNKALSKLKEKVEVVYEETV